MVIGQHMQPFTGNGDVHVRRHMCEKFSSWTPPPQQTDHNIIQKLHKRQLRRSTSPAVGVFVIGLKLTKLDIVYIIENYTTM